MNDNNLAKDIQLILDELRSMGNKTDRDGMARFGIENSTALGIRIPTLRKFAKWFKKDNELSEALWKANIHEAKILAIYLSDPQTFTEKQMDIWVNDFYSWDICDQCCGNLFDKTPYAFKKALEWAKHDEEFVKRAGFVMMATLAVHDKNAEDKAFKQFFKYIKKEAHDERNFVKKAVNWALRQIGKRNEILLDEAIAVAEQIQKQKSKSAKWIATDA